MTDRCSIRRAIAPMLLVLGLALAGCLQQDASNPEEVMDSPIREPTNVETKSFTGVTSPGNPLVAWVDVTDQTGSVTVDVSLTNAAVNQTGPNGTAIATVSVLLGSESVGNREIYNRTVDLESQPDPEAEPRDEPHDDENQDQTVPWTAHVTRDVGPEELEIVTEEGEGVLEVVVEPEQGEVVVVGRLRAHTVPGT